METINITTKKIEELMSLSSVQEFSQYDGTRYKLYTLKVKCSLNCYFRDMGIEIIPYLDNKSYSVKVKLFNRLEDSNELRISNKAGSTTLTEIYTNGTLNIDGLFSGISDIQVFLSA
jgi:hypothetical protein